MSQAEMELVRPDHPWLAEFEGDPEAQFDRIVRGVALIPPYGRADALTVIPSLFEPLVPEDPLLSLLDRTLASEEVRVFLGEETAQMVGCPVSLVAARYHEEDGEPAGALGVIGPTRMDYPFVVPLVGATADAMSAALSRIRGPRGSE